VLVLSPTGADLLNLLDRPAGDSAQQARAERVLVVVENLVRGYTRGRGFNEQQRPDGDLAAVILTGACRLFLNPAADKSLAIGSVSRAYTPFVGWTLAELAVLNRYRRRAG
jgi:hypothetical protein